MSLRFITSPPLASISDHPSSVKPVEYTFNSKIMVAAMVILFIVVFFVVSLHVYAKWFWRQGISSSFLATTGARNVSWRRGRRHSPDVASIESVTPNMCVGLDSSTINSLPTFTYEATQHDMEAPLLECAVCLSEFQAHEKGRFLPNCKHSFHIDCIDMWFHSHSTCPLCRAPVSSLAHQHHEQTTPIQRDFPPPLLQSIVPSTTRQHDERNTTLQRVNSLPLSLLQRPELPTTHHPHQEGPANNASTAPVLPRLEVPLATLLHASNGAGLLCKDGSQAGSLTSLPGIGASGSSSTQWMSTGIPSQPECGAIARCVSLSMPRCPSEEIQARSLQVPQKSSSFRMSIKWLLSRESSKGRSRVFPSSQGNAELEPSTSNSVLPQ